MPETVVIVGASHKKDRYSNMAMNDLLHHGHNVILVHPTLKKIDDHPVISSLENIKTSVDTVTLYISKEISDKLSDPLLKLKPKRVIFNPGTENPTLLKKLNESGIATQEACTLIMLKTNQF